MNENKQLEKVDEVTNEIMGIIRGNFGLDSDTDKDDYVYTEVHKLIAVALNK